MSGRRPWVPLVPLADLLVGVTAALPIAAGGETGISVVAMDLDLPVETRIDRGGELHASLPRGRMATGFDLPHGRVVARFEVVDATPGAER
jgi:hypothetical protein